MGNHAVRLSLVLGGITSCGSQPSLPSSFTSNSTLAEVTSVLRNVPEERVYDAKVLGNLAKRSEIADLRVPHSQSFLIDLSVGTPPQLLRCLLDTGFADLWLPSERCKECKDGHHFRRERSRTYSEDFAPGASGSLSKLFRIKVPFVGKAIQLNLGQDTVALGWGSFRNQSFLLVPQVFLPAKRDWDGICGLGMHRVLVKKEPLWTTLPGGRALFSLVPGLGRRHYFVAGEVPYKACKEGTLSWAFVEPLNPGDDRRFWLIKGGLAIHKKRPVKSRFLLDTGAAFLLAPPHKYLPFVRSLFLMGTFDRLCGWDASAGNVVVCDCSIMKASENLLPLRVYVAGRAFMMQIPELFRRVPTGDGSELCLLQIQRNPTRAVDPLDLLGEWARGVGGAREAEAADQASSDLEDDLWVIGGVFLERFVVVLDFEGQRVGIAEPSGEALPHAHMGARDLTPPANAPQEAVSEEIDILRSEVQRTAQKNAELKAELKDLVRAQEEDVLRAMNEQARRNDLTAQVNNLEQQNRELESRVQSLQYSQEESRAQYQEAQEELAEGQGTWNRLRMDLQELRQRHAALQQRNGELRHERGGLLEFRTKLIALTVCSSMVSIVLLVFTVCARKLRHQLLVEVADPYDVTAREVRVASPWMPSPCSSPEVRRDLDVDVE